MRWVLLLLGSAFMLGLGVSVGQRLGEDALPVVTGVLAGLLACIPTSLFLAWFMLRASFAEEDSVETEQPAEDQSALPNPRAARTQRPAVRAAYERALREQAAAERAAVAQLMQEHAYDQATAQMNPRSDPRIVVVTQPAPYATAGYTPNPSFYPLPPAATPYPPRRFTVIGATETANDEHLVS